MLNSTGSSLRIYAGVLAIAAACAGLSPAVAGEITGNGKDLIINGQSFCAYSGQNDTPDGLWLPIGPGGALVQVDPGGDIQSYGYFKSQSGAYPNPSDLAARSVRNFPGVGCNPNLGGSPTERL
jgi:hypothetical protein